MNQPQRQFDVARPTRLAACPKQWTKINLVDTKLVYQRTTYSLSTVPLQSEGCSWFALRCFILPVMGGINLQLFNIVIVQHYSNDSWFEVVALDIIYVPFVTWIQELVGHCSNFGNLGALYHPHFPCACLASMGILAMAVYAVKFQVIDCQILLFKQLFYSSINCLHSHGCCLCSHAPVSAVNT